MSTCRYCGANFSGQAASTARIESTNVSPTLNIASFVALRYMGGCLNSPSRKHRHGNGNKYLWRCCTFTGSGCLNSPSRTHER